MVGQGSPFGVTLRERFRGIVRQRFVRGRALQRLASVNAFMIVAVLMIGGAVAADELDALPGLSLANQNASNQDEATSSAANTGSGQYTSLDQYTAPFQMRVAGLADPIASTSAGPLTIRVRGLGEAARRSGTLRCEVVRVDDGSVSKRIDEKIKFDRAGDAEPVTVLESVPDTPGVYEVRCRLLADRNPLWSRIAGERKLGEERRFPLLVVSDEKPTQSLNNTVFEAMDAVVPYDREAWHAPAWVPEGASKLVPKVNQLVPDPWHSNSRGMRPSDWIPELLGVIEPNGEFVCKLPQMNASGRYLLAFSVGQPRPATEEGDSSSTDAVGFVEIARDPDFEVVTRRSLLSLPRYLSDTDNEKERLELLHYSCGKEEFVRVHNPSDRAPLVLRSIEVFQAVETDAAPRESSPHRRVTLRVAAPDWRQRITADIDGLKELGFADSTIEMFRVWKSAKRFAENASWLGYDALMIPGQAEDEFVRAHAVTALRRWLAVEGITVEQQEDRFAPTATEIVLERPFNENLTSETSQRPITLASNQLSQLARTSGGQLMLVSEAGLPAVSQSFRRGTREFRYLPIDGFQTITPVDDASKYVSAVAKRLTPSETGKQRWLVSFTNTATWSAAVELRCCAAGTADCARLISDDPDNTPRDGRTPNVRVIDLPPLGIVNLVVYQDGAKPDEFAWRAVTGGPEVLQRIQTQVGQVVARIGLLTQPADYAGLRNGGFEETGPVGIVGWMSTQFPPSAVAIDDSEAIEGQQSIRMTTTKNGAGRTWLVSEPIEIPTTGRLAVSMAVRAAIEELSGDPARSALASAHRIRISLEGNRRGRAMRYAEHFDIPRDGHWQGRRLVLETDELDGDTEFVRLTIDSLSPGQIWIDDIHLHDHFPTHGERKALQGSAFLAIQGLQKGRLQEAADLLRNDWSQQLLANRIRRWPTSRTVAHQTAMKPNRWPKTSQGGDGGVQSRAGVQPLSAGRDQAEPQWDAEPKPSVAERIRSWLPKPLRF